MSCQLVWLAYSDSHRLFDKELTVWPQTHKLSCEFCIKYALFFIKSSSYQTGSGFRGFKTYFNSQNLYGFLSLFIPKVQSCGWTMSLFLHSPEDLSASMLLTTRQLQTGRTLNQELQERRACFVWKSAARTTATPAGHVPHRRDRERCLAEKRQNKH